MKRILIIVALALLNVSTWAQQLTEEQAMSRAIQYLNAKAPAKVSAKFAPKKQGALKAAKVEAQSIYAFNNVDGGFIIASADQRTLPVLGYSNEGSLDWDQLPPNMQEWLKGYDQAIAALGDTQDYIDGKRKGLQLKAPDERAAIEPLIPYHWCQEEPYWNELPTYEGEHTERNGQHNFTGCTATAMAMVMAYHKWPKGESSAIPAYDYVPNYDDATEVLHLDGLPSTTFDWDHLINDYHSINGNDTVILGNDTERAAVAHLMHYCAQSIKTNFGTEGSAAIAEYIAEALPRYFGYASTASSIFRDNFRSIATWEDMIYEELAAARPVIYGGVNKLVGHAFICDGYDGNGLFHINWGWSKKEFNGYFSLSVLNSGDNMPDDKYTDNGFQDCQSAIIGIQPATEQTTPEYYFPSVQVSQPQVYEEDSIYFTFAFYSLLQPEIKVQTTFGTMADDGTLTPFDGDDAPFMVEDKNPYLYDFKVDSTKFSPGDCVLLYPIYRLPDMDNTWKLYNPDSKFVYAGRNESDGSFYLDTEYTEIEMDTLTVDHEGKTLDDLTIFIATFHNDGEIDYTDEITLLPFYFKEELESFDYYRDLQKYDEDDYETGDFSTTFSYIPAGGSGKSTFAFYPNRTGQVLLIAFDSYNTYLGHQLVNLGTTAISAAKASNASAGTRYDLQGRRLSTPPAKGLFIQDGQKVVK